MKRLTNGPAAAPLALWFAARDWLRYARMSDAELAVHDLDRAGVTGRVARRYFH